MEENAYKRLKNKKKREIIKFGISFAIGMTMLLIVSLLRKFNTYFIAAVIFLLCYHIIFAILYYKCLYPTYYLMNFIGKIVGNILNVIIFSIVFYIFMTPIFLILRIFKKDQISISSKVPVWIDVADKENFPERVEKLF